VRISYCESLNFASRVGGFLAESTPPRLPLFRQIPPFAGIPGVLADSLVQALDRHPILDRR
jgi:hypothetical protein